MVDVTFSGSPVSSTFQVPSGSVISRHTKRPYDHVVLDIIQPDQDLPCSGYTIADLSSIPVLTHPRYGTDESPETTYTLLPSTRSDPGVEIEYQVTGQNNSGNIHYIHFSHRGGIVTRWRTKVGINTGSGPITEYYDQDWLARVAMPGYGSSLYGNVQYTEQFLLSSGLWFGHNPTHGGADNQLQGPTTNQGQYETGILNLRTSISVYEDISTSGTDQHIDGAVIPIEFGDPLDRYSGYAYDRDTQVVALWRQRQFQRLQLNYTGNDYLHKMTFWSYEPVSWDGSQDSAEFGPKGNLIWNQAQGVANQRLFDRAYFCSLTSQSLVELSGFSIHTGASRQWVMSKSAILTYSGGSVINSQASIVADGLAGVILHRTGDDFTIAYAVNLESDDTTFVHRGRNLKEIAVYKNNPDTSRHWSGLPDYDKHSPIAVAAECNNTYGRIKGWAGIQGFIYVGSYSGVFENLNTLTGQALYEYPDYSMLPQSLTDGTELGYEETLSMAMSLIPPDIIVPTSIDKTVYPQPAVFHTRSAGLEYSEVIIVPEHLSGRSRFSIKDLTVTFLLGTGTNVFPGFPGPSSFSLPGISSISTTQNPVIPITKAITSNPGLGFLDVGFLTRDLTGDPLELLLTMKLLNTVKNDVTRIPIDAQRTWDTNVLSDLSARNMRQVVSIMAANYGTFNKVNDNIAVPVRTSRRNLTNTITNI